MLSYDYEGLRLYYAGLPSYKRNFTRDALIAGMLSCDYRLLRDQLIFCARLQGKKRDPLTGEEPGKIHHEYPPSFLKITNSDKELSTLYNASDTTALFLIALFFAHAKIPIADIPFLYDAAHSAAEYITSHIDAHGAFIEDPGFANGHTFALKVTYWKDSWLPGREDGVPAYPITYSLVHAQNMRALFCASELLHNTFYRKKALMMRAYLNRLWDPDSQVFIIARDSIGAINLPSSDTLHMLSYLEQDDISQEKVCSIPYSLEKLATKYGYLTYTPKGKESPPKDNYHINTIWPFEQALIHRGALKHGLNTCAAVAQNVMSHPAIKAGSPEYLRLHHDGNILAEGNSEQLWTEAAKVYFTKIKKIDINKTE